MTFKRPLKGLSKSGLKKGNFWELTRDNFFKISNFSSILKKFSKIFLKFLKFKVNIATYGNFENYKKKF